MRHAAADVRRPEAVGLEAFVTALETALARRALRERALAARGEVEADAPADAPPPAFAAWYLETGLALPRCCSEAVCRAPLA